MQTVTSAHWGRRERALAPALSRTALTALVGLMALATNLRMGSLGSGCGARGVEAFSATQLGPMATRAVVVLRKPSRSHLGPRFRPLRTPWCLWRPQPQPQSALAADRQPLGEEGAALAEREGARYALAQAYALAAFLTVVAWTKCSVVALKSHPDASLDAICGPRHNILTTAQALAFALPLILSVFNYLRNSALENEGSASAMNGDATSRRLNLGMGLSSAWVGSAALLTPLFSCGYDLYSAGMRFSAAGAHFASAILCLAVWSRGSGKGSGPLGDLFGLPSRLITGVIGAIRSLSPRDASDDPGTREGSDGRKEFALCAALFAWFGILPIVSPFPLATIPTILGRRLSRAASAWTFLAAVVSFSLKNAAERAPGVGGSSARQPYAGLRRGLATGSFLHLFLVALKLIGVDGGGLLLPGDGLWKVYPMMLQAPFAGVVSILMYSLAIVASMRSNS